jgi:hypothetical protein
MKLLRIRWTYHRNVHSPSLRVTEYSATAQSHLLKGKQKVGVSPRDHQKRTTHWVLDLALAKIFSAFHPIGRMCIVRPCIACGYETIGSIITKEYYIIPPRSENIKWAADSMNRPHHWNGELFNVNFDSALPGISWRDACQINLSG